MVIGARKMVCLLLLQGTWFVFQSPHDISRASGALLLFTHVQLAHGEQMHMLANRHTQKK